LGETEMIAANPKGIKTALRGSALSQINR